MTEIFVPAVVEADPNANATDLLIQRVALTPNDPLFALPTVHGGGVTSPALSFSPRLWLLPRVLLPVE